jgi:hypothetical protein
MEGTMNERLVIVGTDPADIPADREVVVVGCIECGRAAWVVQPDDLILLDHGVRAICRGCAMAAVIRGAGPMVWRTPDFDRLAERIRLGPADRDPSPVPPSLTAALREARRPN